MTTSIAFPQITNRRIATNGIELNIAEQGDPNAPLIVMLHGFPESWFSWRHRFAPLAAAGYHVVAPDMRGYGDFRQACRHWCTCKLKWWTTSRDWSRLWGTRLRSCWVTTGVARPLGAVLCGIRTYSPPSVFYPSPSARSPIPPLDAMKAFFAGRFFYPAVLSNPRRVKAEFEKDVRTGLRRFYHLASGEMDFNILGEKSEHDDLLTGLIDPEHMGPWLSDSDLDFYVSRCRSGFFGPLNYYRNHNETWGLSANKPTESINPRYLTRAGVTVSWQSTWNLRLRTYPKFCPKTCAPMCSYPRSGTGPNRKRRAVNGYLLNWLAELD